MKSEDMAFIRFEVQEKLKWLHTLNELDREREELEQELEKDCDQPTTAYICPEEGRMIFNNKIVEEIVIERDKVRTCFDNHYKWVKENTGRTREALETLTDQERTILASHEMSKELDQVYIKLYEILTGIRKEKHKQAKLQHKARLIVANGLENTKSGKKILSQVI